MKTMPRLLAVLLVFVISSCSCLIPSETTKKPTPSSTEVNSDNTLSVDREGLIRLKFDLNQLPKECTSVEIIYNDQYHGYFNLHNEIFLPRLPGRQKVTAIFSDTDGNKVGDPKIYFIEVP